MLFKKHLGQPRATVAAMSRFSDRQFKAGPVGYIASQVLFLEAGGRGGGVNPGGARHFWKAGTAFVQAVGEGLAQEAGAHSMAQRMRTQCHKSTKCATD